MRHPVCRVGSNSRYKRKCIDSAGKNKSRRWNRSFYTRLCFPNTIDFENSRYTRAIVYGLAGVSVYCFQFSLAYLVFVSIDGGSS